MRSALVRAVMLMMVVAGVAAGGVMQVQVVAGQEPSPLGDGAIVITEIMFNPAGGDDPHEWVEIRNNGVDPVNLTDWRFWQNGNHVLNFYQGSLVLQPGAYAVLVDDGSTFMADYPGYPGTVIDSSFTLSNTGERLALRNGTAGPFLDEVVYSSGWGGIEGYSLECRNFSADNNMSLNWALTRTPGGTPGAQNDVHGEFMPMLGDWEVGAASVVTHQNKTIYMDGNLSVYGALTFINVTFVMNTTFNGSNWIRVMDGGEFMVRDYDGNPDTEGDNSLITTADTGGQTQLNFWVNATGWLRMENSTLAGCGFQTEDQNDYYMALHIWGDDCVLWNVDFMDCTGGAIFNTSVGGGMYNCYLPSGFGFSAANNTQNIVYSDNVVGNASMVGIYVNGSGNTVLTGNVINDTVVGIVFEESYDGNASSNVITNSTMGGIAVWGSWLCDFWYNDISHTHTGVSIEESDNCTLVENDVSYVETGVYFYADSDVAVEYNDIWNVTYHVLYADMCLRLDVNNNWLYDGAAALRATNTSDSWFMGNTVEDMEYAGFFISEGSRGNFLYYNDFNGTGAGIVVENTPYNGFGDEQTLYMNSVTNATFGYYSNGSAVYSNMDSATACAVGFYFFGTATAPWGPVWSTVWHGSSNDNMGTGLWAEEDAWVWVLDTTLTGNNVGLWSWNATVVLEASTVSQDALAGVISEGPEAWVQVENSSVSPVGGMYWGDYVTMDNGTIHSINSTHTQVESMDGTVIISNYLHVHVSEQESGADMEDVDVRVTSDNADIYNTTGYGGADPRTNATGHAGWILAHHQWYVNTNTATQNVTKVEVWDDIASGSNWHDSRSPIDMSATHTEYFTLDETPPDAPIDLIVTAVGESSITVNWTASPSADVNQYAIYLNETGTSSLIQHQLIGNLTSWTIDFLAPRTLYYIAVEAWDEFSNPSTAKSNVVQETTIDETPPEKPDGLYTSDVTGTSIKVHWAAQFDDDLDGFSVYVSAPNSTDGYTLFDNATAGSTFLVVDGLESETTYYFKVASYDDYDVPNPSDLSDPVSNTTLDVSPPLPPILDHFPSPINDSTINIQGFVYKGYDSENKSIKENAATVTVYVNNVSMGSAEALSVNGRFSVPVILAPGMNYIDAVAQDDAPEPNTSPKSKGIIIILDQQDPDADAGGDINVPVGTTVLFDGGNSTDNTKIITYTWTFMYDGELQILDNDFNTTTTHFTFDEAGVYEVTMIIGDAAGNSAEDMFFINVTAGDETAPSVTSHSPGDGDTDVPVDTTVSATFSEGVNASSLSLLLLGGGGDNNGSAKFSSDRKTLTWTPENDLEYETEYTVRLSVSDPAGNELKGFSWKFTTEEADEVEPDPDLDTDGDNLPDVWEIDHGLDPRDPTDAVDDSDQDGISNLDEYLGPDGIPNTGDETDPENQDSDGDGFSDKEEIEAGTDPNNAASRPKVEEGGGGGDDEDPLAAIGGTMGLIAIIAIVVIVVVLVAVMVMRKSKKEAAASQDAFFAGGEKTPEGAAGAEGEVDMGEGTCRSCGASLTPGAEFCPECGEVFDKKPDAGPEAVAGATGGGALAGTGEKALPPGDETAVEGEEEAPPEGEEPAGEGEDEGASDEGAGEEADGFMDELESEMAGLEEDIEAEAEAGDGMSGEEAEAEGATADKDELDDLDLSIDDL